MAAAGRGQRQRPWVLVGVQVGSLPDPCERSVHTRTAGLMPTWTDSGPQPCLEGAKETRAGKRDGWASPGQSQAFQFSCPWDC